MNWKNLFTKTTYTPLNTDLLKEYNQHRPLGPQKMVCYAPFRSIYFGHHGKAVACCYNRTHILGQYPKQSIKEIWFGKEADKLRDYIKHNDFSLGCGGCKQQIVAQNFDAVKAKQYDERRANKNRYPSVMEFELSNTCNLECEMCSGDFSSLIRSKREHLPPIESPYDETFVKQLDEFIPYLEEVKFYGGEPFLIEVYYQIWERIMELNPAVRISVQTNGTTLNNRVKRILANTNFHINVSVDSLQKETYEHIRKNAVYERTMENVKWFREYCRERNTFFGISMCAMRNNWRELPDFIRFCNEMDVPVYFHTVFNPMHLSIHNLKPREIQEIVLYLSSFKFPSDSPVQVKNKTHYENTINQFRNWLEKAPLNDMVRNLKLKKISDLEVILIDYIRNDEALMDEARESKIESIRKKLSELQKEFPQDLFEQIVPEINMQDPYFCDNMISALTNMSIAQFISTAKERLNA